MSRLFDLTGKVAIVTGGSGGLGSVMALGLAEAGAKIAIADILDSSGTISQIKKLGREAVGLKADVTKRDDAEKMVQQVVKKFGKIDILLNCAGVFRPGASEDLKEEDWDKTIAVNLKGTFLCAQAVGKQMIKQKSGSIINISSVAGQFAFVHPASKNSVSYNASKAGVILLTKTLAAEWGKYNIRVNAICPGTFLTEMTTILLKDKRYSQMMKERVPLGRPGVPKELVGTVIYLASNASDYVSGQALTVDGGWSAGI